MTTTRKVECRTCNGLGAEGHEDAPGCYTWERLCRACDGEGVITEDVEKCEGCKVETAPAFLHGYGPDAAIEWLCPKCMLRVMKTCGEHPVVTPTVEGLYSASWATIARAGR